MWGCQKNRKEGEGRGNKKLGPQAISKNFENFENFCPFLAVLRGKKLEKMGKPGEMGVRV